MRLISLGECNKDMIYPLIAALGGAIFNIMLYTFEDDTEINNHPFILGINAGFGMSLAIIPDLCIKNRAKKLKNKKILDTVTEVKLEKWLIVFLCAFLDFLQKILVFLFSYNITNNVWIFNIIFLNAFSYMLYNHKLYKHQYITSGIMIVFGIALNAINLFEITLNDIPILCLSIFIEIIYSLAIVLAKYGMDLRCCTPFEITFYEGLFALILNIIFLLVSTLIPLNTGFKYGKILKISKYEKKNYLDNIFAYIKNSDWKEILIFILNMLARTIFNLFSHFTIKHFTSSHVILILIFSELALAFTNKMDWKTIFTIVVFFVEFIMLLIFCEVIELNFCGLSENTRKNIRERAALQDLDDLKFLNDEEPKEYINFMEFKDSNSNYLSSNSDSSLML